MKAMGAIYVIGEYHSFCFSITSKHWGHQMSRIIPPFPLHQRLKLLRLFAGFSESAMAKIMKCTTTHLAKVESGKSDISAEELSCLRSCFQISSDLLLDGPIPYFQVALDFNKSGVLETKYRSGVTRPISCLSPLIGLLQSASESKLFESVLKSLKIHSFVFADPEIPVNEAFIHELLNAPALIVYFVKEANFKRLRSMLVKLFEPDQIARLQAAGNYQADLIESWLEVIFAPGKRSASAKDSKAHSQAQDLTFS